jgi:hypothetical protein
MSTFLARNRTIWMASLLMPCAAVVVGALAHGRPHMSTLASAIALLIGTALIVLTTWRHAQPVASLRQQLYTIEHPGAHGARTSWDRWLAHADRGDARGRILAAFWLSLAVSGLIAYAWFA